MRRFSRILLLPFLTRHKRGVATDRGVAIITAILVVAMMVIFTSDMIINSTVSLQLAASTRDNVKAEYMAKSGLNLAIFLLQADWGTDLATFQATGGQTMPSDGPDDLWGKLNGMPIGGSSMAMMAQTEETFDLNKVNDSGVIDQLKLFDGEFTIEVADEKSRININHCFKGQAFECEYLLKALLSCPAERAFLEKRKIKADELFANVKDWVDEDETPGPASGNSSEQDPYEGRDPKVRPKNAPFDSLEELKLVAGWDDDLYKIFSPYLTVYPYQETEGKFPDKPFVNINSAARELVACLLPQTNFASAEKASMWFDPPPNKLKADQANSLERINQMAAELFGEGDKERTKYFTYLSDTYRVTVKGEVGDTTRTLVAVVQRKFPTDEEKKAGLKTTYKILHFKML